MMSEQDTRKPSSITETPTGIREATRSVETLITKALERLEAGEALTKRVTVVDEEGEWGQYQITVTNYFPGSGLPHFIIGEFEYGGKGLAGQKAVITHEETDTLQPPFEFILRQSGIDDGFGPNKDEVGILHSHPTRREESALLQREAPIAIPTHLAIMQAAFQNPVRMNINHFPIVNVARPQSAATLATSG